MDTLIQEGLSRITWMNLGCCQPIIDRSAIFVSHGGTTSVKNVEHFAQNLIHAGFHRFDYG